MKQATYSEAEKNFFRNTTQAEANAIWKSHRGKKLKAKFCAVTWCVSMGYLTKKSK